MDPTSNRGGASINHVRYVVQRGRCLYCGARKPMGDMTQDHVTPKRQGGSHTAHNVALCCLPCNEQKGDRIPTKREVEAAAILGAAVLSLVTAWRYQSDRELAHMGNGQQITAFVDRAMTGREPEPQEAAE